MKHLYFSLLFFLTIICYGQGTDSVTINVIQPDVYIVKNEWSQQINFDFHIENNAHETIHLKRIELFVYDKNENPVNIVALRDGPVTPSIGTVPVRQIQKNENITLYNPFTVFNPYIDLHLLKYILSFRSESGNNFTAEVNVHPELYVSKTDLAVPLKGKLFILDGSDFYSNHRRFDVNNPLVRDILGIYTNPDMFAVDFSVIDSNGNEYSGNWKENANYYIFGTTVYSSGNGKIIKVINNYEDNIPGTLNFDIQDVKNDKDLLAGNCVVIDHQNGEFSFLVHLKEGSITVQEGETVRKGQPVAQVGNSGSSMYPHLHYQLGDKPHYTNSNGLPVYFHNYNLISGNEKVKIRRGYLNTGDIIENKN